MKDLDTESLINSSFKVPEGQSFYQDFPVWRPDAGVRAWAEKIYRNNVLAAVANGRMAELRIGNEALPCGIIGGVATAEPYRGQGLGRRVVEAARDRLIQEGARLVVLWGSDRSWYGRMGFQPAGTQSLVSLHDLSGFSNATSSGLELRGGFTPELFEHLKETRCRFGGLELAERDLGWMSRHMNVRWFSACSRDTDQIKAYAAVGRGIDFGGVIHEWGGEVGALHAILVTFKKEAPHLLLMGNPRSLSAYGLLHPGVQPITDSAALAYWTHESDAAQFGPELWLWGLDSA